MFGQIGYYPMINTLLLVVLLGLLLVFVSRMAGARGDLREEVLALKLRLTVQEQISPCQHCRTYHVKDHVPGREDVDCAEQHSAPKLCGPSADV
jgi:hypothetical protein